MKKLLIIACCFAALSGYAQTATNVILRKPHDPFGLVKPILPRQKAFTAFNISPPDYIKRLDSIFKNRRIDYDITFTDTIKFRYPGVKGKNLGMATITNKKYPNCSLNYFVFEYDDRDTINKQISKFYTFSNFDQFHIGPFAPRFFMDKYVFFMHFVPYWGGFDDRAKYMSLRIANDMDQYMRYRTVKK